MKLAFVALALLVASCSSHTDDSAFETLPDATFEGDWVGAFWSSPTDESTEFAQLTLNVVQANANPSDALGGSAHVTAQGWQGANWNCQEFDQLDVTGTINGDHVVLRIVGSGLDVAIEATQTNGFIGGAATFHALPPCWPAMQDAYFVASQDFPTTVPKTTTLTIVDIQCTELESDPAIELIEVSRSTRAR